MIPMPKWAIEALVVGAAVAGLYFAARAYCNHREQVGYNNAVADGIEARRAADAANLKREGVLRKKLSASDDLARTKEVEHAQELETAVRRAAAGSSGMRCPARPVPAGEAPADRPASQRPPADTERAELVPEAAADLLSIGAGYAGILRKYDRLQDRFNACREMNNAP